MYLGKQGYDQTRATVFMRQFSERIRDLPGVTAVAQAERAAEPRLQRAPSSLFQTAPERSRTNTTTFRPTVCRRLAFPLCGAGASDRAKRMTHAGSSSQNRPQLFVSGEATYCPMTSQPPGPPPVCAVQGFCFRCDRRHVLILGKSLQFS